MAARGRKDKFVRTNTGGVVWVSRGADRQQEGANIERTSARALLRSFPVMHDAMLLTLYAHRNNPIFLLRFPSSSCIAAAVSFRRATLEDDAPRSSIRPRLFISIYFSHRIPHLYPSASSHPGYTRYIARVADLRVYFITARNVISRRHRRRTKFRARCSS